MKNNPSSRVVSKRGGHWYIADSPATKWDADHVKVLPLATQPPVVRVRHNFRELRDGFFDTLTLKWWSI